jgi:hydrogenase nickel incorporation protein HypA/HybF
MHELSITEGILKIVVEESKKNNAKRVTRIKIKMGELSDVLPDSVVYYFGILSEKTIAEGAVLDIERIPLKISCTDCSEIANINMRKFRCPKCGSQNLRIVEGNEFYIDSLEAE